MGPSGSGQVTKLLNNAMTMSNLDNAVDLIRLVSRLGMNVLAAAAAPSCVLSAAT
jgi:3-hydroxyisobutyrate dehydrogenase-like beta-hydroxyacid dehydrogenase